MTVNTTGNVKKVRQREDKGYCRALKTMGSAWLYEDFTVLSGEKRRLFATKRKPKKKCL